MHRFNFIVPVAFSLLSLVLAKPSHAQWTQSDYQLVMSEGGTATYTDVNGSVSNNSQTTATASGTYADGTPIGTANGFAVGATAYVQATWRRQFTWTGFPTYPSTLTVYASSHIHGSEPNSGNSGGSYTDIGSLMDGNNPSYDDSAGPFALIFTNPPPALGLTYGLHTSANGYNASTEADESWHL